MIGWGMKKHFTNGLAVIFAVVGVYFVAFKVLMKVRVVVIKRYIDPDMHHVLWARHEPRWGIYHSAQSETLQFFFAPLIWLDTDFRGGDRWYSDGKIPQPDWVKEYRAKAAKL